MKTYHFLDGSQIDVEDNVCRGCYLETASLLPEELNPIVSNNNFVIRQDAECPVPAFFILATKAHINTFADLNDEMAMEIGLIIRTARSIMKEHLNIERIHIFLEERMINPHLHIWLLPLWSDVMKKNNIDPKIWNGNIKTYLDLFHYTETKSVIKKYNTIMRDACLSNTVFRKYGYK